MPHVSRFRLNGQLIPSVNTITGSLSQEGLIRGFYRPLGFKKADKVGAEAREKGIALATAFEDYRKTGKMPRTKFAKTCTVNWIDWFGKSGLTISQQFVEPHLVNTVEGYHGSPDIVLAHDGEPVLGDDKAKKRFSDYKILMNEMAYAQCDSYEDAEGKIVPVPWDVPIKTFWLWTYSDSGLLYPVKHEYDPVIWQDFLTCKQMLMVNRRAEKYFAAYATLLPEAAA